MAVQAMLPITNSPMAQPLVQVAAMGFGLVLMLQLRQLSKTRRTDLSSFLQTETKELKLLVAVK